MKRSLGDDALDLKRQADKDTQQFHWVYEPVAEAVREKDPELYRVIKDKECHVYLYPFSDWPCRITHYPTLFNGGLLVIRMEHISNFHSGKGLGMNVFRGVKSIIGPVTIDKKEDYLEVAVGVETDRGNKKAIFHCTADCIDPKRLED